MAHSKICGDNATELSYLTYLNFGDIPLPLTVTVWSK